MNSFGSWWDDTITIYNKYKDPTTQQVKWFRHVVENAFWKDTGNKITIGNVTLDTNNIICRIRKNSDYLDKEEWIDYTDWMSASTSAQSAKFTLSVGDIIVKGSVSDVIDEYTSGSRSSDLLKRYKELQGCMEIQKCANNTGNRGNEHYYASGK